MIVKSPQEEKAILKVMKIYLNAERQIVNEITRKRSLNYVDYAEVAALERVQQILTEMQSDSFLYIPEMVETIFHGQGAKNAAGYENARVLTSAETSVVQTLVNNLLGEVIEVSDTVLDSAKKYLAVARLEGDELRESALEAVASQQAIGHSWTIAQKSMKADLLGKGITAYVDKAGRKWTLSDYCNMAVRTTAKQAGVAAILTRDDYDLWQIVRIGSTCPVCAVYEGRVYSKSGTNPDYPPLASAFGKIDKSGPDTLENTYLNIHPSCLHSLVKYTTIGKTKEQIQKDKDFSSFEKNPLDHDPRTKKQRKAYQNKMRNRQRLLNDTRQWKKYKAALGNEIPTFETFLKHKRADNEKYKEWMRKFRGFNKEASDVNSLINTEIKTDIKPKASKLILSNVDITDNWTKKTAGGSVTEKNSVILNGEKFVVDGKHVLMDHNDSEKHIAAMLAAKYGKNVELLPRIVYPQKRQVADYLIDGSRYDLKTITGRGKDVLRDLIKKHKGQARKFVINASQSPLTQEELERQIDIVFKAPNTRFVDELVIVNNDMVQKVYKRK